MEIKQLKHICASVTSKVNACSELIFQWITKLSTQLQNNSKIIQIKDTGIQRKMFLFWSGRNSIFESPGMISWKNKPCGTTRHGISEMMRRLWDEETRAFPWKQRIHLPPRVWTEHKLWDWVTCCTPSNLDKFFFSLKFSLPQKVPRNCETMCSLGISWVVMLSVIRVNLWIFVT